MKKICLIIFIVLGAHLNTLAPILDKEYRNNRFEQIVKIIEEEIAFNKRVDLLLQAIKIVESGGDYTIKGKSGEIGAYQFTRATYRMYSYLYFKELLPMTPENQDKIARKKIENLVKAGFTDSEIASFWNSGSPKWKGKVGVNKYGVKYNVPKYVEKFNETIKKLNTV
jgi:hypothetical protein